MATATARDVIVALGLLAALTACNPNPAPRGSAYQGVPAAAGRSTLNAPYYLGADPDYQRGKSGGGP